MNKIVKVLFYLLSISFLLLFSLDWLVWGQYVPQGGSLGLLGYVGIVAALAFLAILLEFIPELLKFRR